MDSLRVITKVKAYFYINAANKDYDKQILEVGDIKKLVQT